MIKVVKCRRCFSDEVEVKVKEKEHSENSIIVEVFHYCNTCKKEIFLHYSTKALELSKNFYGKKIKEHIDRMYYETAGELLEEYKVLYEEEQRLLKKVLVNK